MVQVSALWLPVLVSAGLVFVASSVVHMLLRYHDRDFQPVPDEEDVQTALRRFNLTPGDYMLPRPSGPAEMQSQAFAALLIGFARGIFVVLNDGHVIDTLVRALSTPLEGLPPAVAVAGMVGLQTLIHVPVPSVSGQAVLTLPILAPLSDLLQVSRQVTVLAYQTGAGLCDLITPTNGALMAMLAAAGVRYDQWLRFALPFWAALAALGTAGALLALALGLA